MCGGLAGIMFDSRAQGTARRKLEPWQKLYFQLRATPVPLLDCRGGHHVVLVRPQYQLPHQSALLNKRKFKGPIADACRSFTM